MTQSLSYSSKSIKSKAKTTFALIPTVDVFRQLHASRSKVHSPFTTRAGLGTVSHSPKEPPHPLWAFRIFVSCKSSKYSSSLDVGKTSDVIYLFPIFFVLHVVTPATSWFLSSSLVAGDLSCYFVVPSRHLCLHVTFHATSWSLATIFVCTWSVMLPRGP